MKSHTKNSPILLLAACALVISFCLPLLTGAGNKDQPVLEANRLRIEKMSREERNHLRQQFNMFKQLPEEDRVRLEQIHNAITADHELQNIVANYQEWLKTITVWQREEINREKNPQARMNLIGKFMDQEEKKNSDAAPSSIPGGGSRVRRLFASLPSLSKAELKELMSIIVSRLKMDTATRKKLEAMPALESNLQILQKVHDSVHPEELRNNWPDNRMLDAFHTKTSNKNVVARLDLMKDDFSKRQFVKLLLVKSLYSQWQKELQRTIPSEQEITAYFEQLSPKSKDEVMRRGGKNKKRLLIQMYRRDNDQDFMQQGNMLRQITKVLRTGNGGGGRPGERRPQRPGPGGKPRRDGDFPSRRPVGWPKDRPKVLKRTEKTKP